MMNKNTTAIAYGIVLATMYATLVTSVIYGIWPGLKMLPVLLVFVSLWVGFCLAGIWSIYRKDELARKFPVSGPEHRKRNMQFYDWLRSQVRR
jgi:hypothetical protein